MARRKYSDEELARALSMLRGGMTWEEVRRETGISPATLSRYMARLEGRAPSSRSEGSGLRRGELEQALRSDEAHFINAIKARLDPRAPILLKEIEDMAWWKHLREELTVMLLPEALRRLRMEEVDRRNPEATAKLAASRLLDAAAQGDALKARLEEAEAKLRAAEGEWRAKLAEHEEALRRYRELVEEYRRLVDELGDRAKKTIAYFMMVVPKGLPPDAVEDYMLMARRVEEVWAG
jgi:AraC-like DNA-binding protein